jgi:heparanase 1
VVSPNIITGESMPADRFTGDHFRVLLGGEQVAVISSRYLSLTIDISLVLGGHWWGRGKGISRGVAIDMVAPIDLKDARLLAFAKLLAPAMIRIGGTEADRVQYHFREKNPRKQGAPVGPARSPHGELVLERSLWKRINAFASKAGFDILFVVNAGPGQRDAEGAWMESGARALIVHAAERRLAVRAWELGNEVNAYPLTHGFRNRVSASRYVEDFARFSGLIRKLRPGALAVGPASAVLPAIGEPNPIMPALGRSRGMRSDDVMSWHYYPQQSSRGRFANRRASRKTLLKPRHLDSVRKQARRVAKYARGRPVWMTETGHALYGGEPGQSDTYLSSIWWLDQLGLLAREGVSRVFRQSLVGSDYGLLDQDTFQPRPDFYASFLWKRLMGNRVFRARTVEKSGGRIRAYCHSAARGLRGRCLLFISLRKARSLITVPGLVWRRYVIEPVGGICASHLALNGVPLEDDLAFGWEKESTRRKYRVDVTREELRADRDAAVSEVILPPYACAFVLLREASLWLWSTRCFTRPPSTGLPWAQRTGSWCITEGYLFGIF